MEQRQTARIAPAVAARRSAYGFASSAIGSSTLLGVSVFGNGQASMTFTSADGVTTLVPALICLALMLGVYWGEVGASAVNITAALAWAAVVFTVANSGDIRVSQGGLFGYSVATGQALAICGLVVGGTFAFFADNRSD